METNRNEFGGAGNHSIVVGPTNHKNGSIDLTSVENNEDLTEAVASLPMSINVKNVLAHLSSELASGIPGSTSVAVSSVQNLFEGIHSLNCFYFGTAIALLAFELG